MENDFLRLLPMAQPGGMKALHARCLQASGESGMTLTLDDIAMLTVRRGRALTDNGRVEFGGGVTEKLVSAFCSSPYIPQSEFADTLAELQDIFYYYKNESLDALTDDELIGFMRECFDGKACGSLDYLSGTGLEELCRRIRTGEGEPPPGESDEEEVSDDA